MASSCDCTLVGHKAHSSEVEGASDHDGKQQRKQMHQHHRGAASTTKKKGTRCHITIVHRNDHKRSSYVMGMSKCKMMRRDATTATRTLIVQTAALQ